MRCFAIWAYRHKPNFGRGQYENETAFFDNGHMRPIIPNVWCNAFAIYLSSASVFFLPLHFAANGLRKKTSCHRKQFIALSVDIPFWNTEILQRKICKVVVVIIYGVAVVKVVYACQYRMLCNIAVKPRSLIRPNP
jgi:hypothetical protein